MLFVYLEFHVFSELLWILTRQRQPSEEAIQAAKKVIQDNKLSETFLMKSTQTDCPTIAPQNDDDDDQVASASSTADENRNSIEFSSPSTERIMESA